MRPLSDILADASAIARGAGAIILQHFSQPIVTSLKSTRTDVVTATDTAAETYIVGELTNRRRGRVFSYRRYVAKLAAEPRRA